MTTGKLAALAVAAIAACGEAAQADAYGIADPAERLAAIRAKWPNAADRVSQWAMPDLEERFFEIDELQDWCEEDPENRYAQFEEACRDAIKYLGTDPRATEISQLRFLHQNVSKTDCGTLRRKADML